MVAYTILDEKTGLINLNQPLSSKPAAEMRSFFEQMSEQGIQQVIINLEHVSFIDSDGLAALVFGLKLFGDGANFYLAAPQLQPRLLFELTSFDQIFHLSDSVGAARTTADSTLTQTLPRSGGGQGGGTVNFS